jgi:hypothetical protein
MKSGDFFNGDTHSFSDDRPRASHAARPFPLALLDLALRSYPRHIGCSYPPCRMRDWRGLGTAPVKYVGRNGGLDD